MTRTTAKDILISRIGFKGDTPVSGRFFEGGHSIVTLDNIRECQPKQNITDEEFNTYKTEIKTNVIYQLLADVYDSDDVQAETLDFKPALFDNCIIILMTIKVIELIITSQRSNITERISKEAAQQIHFDLNGNYGKDYNPNFPRAFGIADKYKDELRIVKNAVGKPKMLKSITTR